VIGSDAFSGRALDGTSNFARHKSSAVLDTGVLRKNPISTEITYHRRHVD
jgi:hypothetical protein